MDEGAVHPDVGSLPLGSDASRVRLSGDGGARLCRDWQLCVLRVKPRLQHC